MDILIVAHQREIAELWAACLRRMEANVQVEATQSSAVRALQVGHFDIVILSLDLNEGSPLAVADFVSYRHPGTKIIPVTSSSFFSDGSVFQHIPNACTSLGIATSPDDVAAIVEHYGLRAARRSGVPEPHA